jgi:hypothetical protein
MVWWAEAPLESWKDGMMEKWVFKRILSFQYSNIPASFQHDANFRILVGYHFALILNTNSSIHLMNTNLLLVIDVWYWKSIKSKSNN